MPDAPDKSDNMTAEDLIRLKHSLGKSITWGKSGLNALEVEELTKLGLSTCGGYMRIRTRIFILVLLLMVLTIPLSAQYTVVSAGVLARTMMIRYQNETATVFTVDIDNREYWITAKHLFTKAKHAPYGSFTQKVVIVDILPEMRQEHETATGWISGAFKVLDPGQDIDILILASNKPVIDTAGPQHLIQTSGGPGPTFGADCEFVGFPYGSAWQAMWETGEMLRLPFIKHCTVSGRFSEPQSIYVLDGINNHGFSGGPVVFGSTDNQYIFAVISGYQPEPVEVVPVEENKSTPKSVQPQKPKAQPKTDQHPKEKVDVNSGFIFAYDFKYVIDAVRRNPFGPLRPVPSPKQ